MEQGRAFLHRVQHPGEDGQELVFDLDKAERFFGDVDVTGGDGRDGLPLVEDLVPGEAIGGKMGEIDRPLAEVGDLVLRVREVSRGGDGQDSGDRFGGAGVDRPDPPV
ncbi:MAG: hypothetical protein MK554_14730, partial [Planctomycetes bacterium]|nr:hypothetical protein [Planctomycetota bacterium]